MKKKIEGYQSGNEQVIFPLDKRNKSKFLEAKDYVEIAIRYCLLNDWELLSLIIKLFHEDDLETCINLFPTYLYKLLIYYEKLTLFESLYEKEKQYGNVKSSHIITDWFSYWIIINNITIALYLLKKFAGELKNRNEEIIDSILVLLTEYTQSSGTMKYKHGIAHFEELLYFIEIFIKSFSYTQTHYLYNIFFGLIRPKTCEDEDVDSELK